MVYFQTKNSNLEIFFGRPWSGNFSIFYSHLVNFNADFMVIRHILLSFGAFRPILVYFTKKNLATLD
jgi:hypothetical protein